jgi:uncharacterized protein DUF4421
MFVFCLSIIAVNSVYSQKIPLFKDPLVDSTYVDLLPGKWSLRAYSSAPYQVFSIRNKENDQQIKYRPNNILGIGLGFSYRFLVVDLGLNLKTKLSDATSRIDLQMSLLMQKHLLDLYLQTYSGFEIAQAPTDQGEFREDIRSSALGINYHYNFNGKKLSFRSAFSGDQLQRRSTGTLTLGGYFSHYRLKADSSIIAPSSQIYFNEYTNITTSNHTGLGISSGFAYSFVFPMNFFLFTGASPGIGLNFGKVEADQSYTPPLGPELKLNVKTSFGYAGPRIYVICSFTSDYYFINLGHQNRFRYNPAKIKLVFGYRLQSKVKFLEKVNDNFKAD